ncbi:hypothetical protein FLP10_14700 [Agromyces intestinalis]|uniref:Histidinol dehydrogenase n=1 Tax=Agromyces intestinalis TaxID=2592652 RepID=A0A5C1YHV5_9MICO|nr:hypothetical protein [Agromyces intestinalis]QEO15543.1 hypothetical protein FLP10_14700 [Agromyces intestinalis]
MSEIGNRVVTIVVGAAIGLVYGAIATIGHRHELRIGDVTIPWGLTLAILGVAALLVGIRLVMDRLSSAAAAAGIVAIVAVLTLPGVGGSILVAGDIRGTIWAVTPAVVGVLVVAWPSLPARRSATAPVGRRVD